MKLKSKKYLYIFSYIIVIIGIGYVNDNFKDDAFYFQLMSNPIFFLIIDGILLHFLMKKLEKEPYALQRRVIFYFKTMNNLFLFFALFCFGASLSMPIDLIGNFILFYFLRPMATNPDEINGVAEYFSKYPEKEHSRFYKDSKEIKKDYQSLKEELEVEIPALSVVAKNDKKDKRREIVMTILPIVIISLVVVGMAFSIVEIFKTFERAQCDYFEIIINDQEMNIFYEEKYFRTIIPFIYYQQEDYSFQSNANEYTNNNYLNRGKRYVIELKEYQCINNDKGNNVRVSCGSGALSERKEEIESINNSMTISFEGEKIYSGTFKEDITEYLEDNGMYKISIINKRGHLTSTIEFNLSINEIAVDD